MKSKSLKKPEVKHKRKRTYIEDIEKFSKWVPGPGKYEENPEMKQVSHRKTRKVDIQ